MIYIVIFIVVIICIGAAVEAYQPEAPRKSEYTGKILIKTVDGSSHYLYFQGSKEEALDALVEHMNVHKDESIKINKLTTVNVRNITSTRILE